MALYKGSKQLKVYKGDAKPVNVFSKGVKVAGWKEETQSGNVLLFKNAYNDKVSFLKVCGNYLQGEATTASPVTPDFCGKSRLYCGGVNLFDASRMNEYKTAYWSQKWEFIDDKTISNTSVLSAGGAYCYLIPVKPNKKYYLSYIIKQKLITNSTVSDDTAIFTCYDQEKRFLTNTSIGKIYGERGICSFSTKETTTGVYLSASWGASGKPTDVVQPFILTDIMLVEGDNMPDRYLPHNGEEITLPESITLDDGSVVDIPLKAIKKPDETVGAYDYIEVNGGKVSYHNIVGKYVFTSKNEYTLNSDFKKATTFQMYAMGWQTIGLNSENLGLCSHSNKMDTSYQLNFVNDIECFGVSNRVQFRVKYEMLGCTKESTATELTTAWKEWLDSQEANGTPLTVWYRKESTTVKDITASDFGRKLLNLVTVYPQTAITFTGAAAIPSADATIKIQEE